MNRIVNIVTPAAGPGDQRQRAAIGGIESQQVAAVTPPPRTGQRHSPPAHLRGPQNVTQRVTLGATCAGRGVLHEADAAVVTDDRAGFEQRRVAGVCLANHGFGVQYIRQALQVRRKTPLVILGLLDHTSPILMDLFCNAIYAAEQRQSLQASHGTPVGIVSEQTGRIVRNLQDGWFLCGGDPGVAGQRQGSGQGHEPPLRIAHQQRRALQSFQPQNACADHAGLTRLQGNCGAGRRRWQYQCVLGNEFCFLCVTQCEQPALDMCHDRRCGIGIGKRWVQNIAGDFHHLGFGAADGQHLPARAVAGKFQAHKDAAMVYAGDRVASAHGAAVVVAQQE